MNIRQAVARTIRRLNLQGLIMGIPIFGQALYDALSMEFDRVNDFRDTVKNSVVPNSNMDVSTLDDYEKKYGVDSIISYSDPERIDRIIEAAARDGNGGPDWLQEQIQKAGFPLYVHINTRTVSLVPQFGNFQFDQITFGGSINYIDPRTVDGIIVASSPNGNIGPQYINFGSLQFGAQQFGELQPNTANPRPKPFQLSSDPNTWGYVFFLSPFEDRLAGPSELLQLSEEELNYLKKIVRKLKHVRNWAIVQAEAV